MTKLAPEWVRTSDPVIRSPARYRWTMAPARALSGGTDISNIDGYYADEPVVCILCEIRDGFMLIRRV